MRTSPSGDRAADRACAGRAGARHLRSRSIAFAAAHARARGIIIADTKFEFGLDRQGGLVLMDEVLTPDSSRFWPAGTWRVGSSPPSFDKQFVRDYLETLDWNKRAPGPHLPAAVIDAHQRNYREALRRLTAGGLAARRAHHSPAIVMASMQHRAGADRTPAYPRRCRPRRCRAASRADCRQS